MSVIHAQQGGTSRFSSRIYTRHFSSCFPPAHLLSLTLSHSRAQTASLFSPPSPNQCSSREGQPDNSSCTECPRGQFQPDEGESRCRDCFSGQFMTTTGALACTNCPGGQYREAVLISLDGLAQDTGTNTSEPCPMCPAGYFSYEGRSECNKCEEGRYSNKSGVGAIWDEDAESGQPGCTICPVGLYAPDKMSPECWGCSNEYVPDPTQKVCRHPLYKIKSDCNSRQYLNNTGNNTMLHECVACPDGASCEGDIDYDGVRGMFGYWRVPGPTPEIFLPCFFPGACLGAPNPALMNQYFMPSEEEEEEEAQQRRLESNEKENGITNASTSKNNDGVKDFAQMDSPEGCNIHYGFLNGSRMCHTCIRFYRRQGRHQCAKCESTRGFDLLFLAFQFAFLSSPRTPFPPVPYTNKNNLHPF